MHQLRDRKLVARCKNSADIATEEAICCAFTLFQDDWTDSEWKGITMNPARKTFEMWKQVGIEVPFTAPWGRSHRPQAESGMGKQCATLQFHARVRKPQLGDLLRKSGYNKVYVTPKSWIGELLPGYAVVWVQVSHEEITALAMTAQGQRGLVRSKARVGARAPEQSFRPCFNSSDLERKPLHGSP